MCLCRVHYNSASQLARYVRLVECNSSSPYPYIWEREKGARGNLSPDKCIEAGYFAGCGQINIIAKAKWVAFPYYSTSLLSSFGVYREQILEEGYTWGAI